MVKRDLGLFKTVGCCEKNKPAPEERPDPFGRDGLILVRVGFLLVLSTVVDDGDCGPLTTVAIAAQAEVAC